MSTKKTTVTLRTLTAISADLKKAVKLMNDNREPKTTDTVNDLLKEYTNSARAKAFRDFYATAHPMETAILAKTYSAVAVKINSDTTKWEIVDTSKRVDILAFIDYMNDRSADKSGKTAPTSKKLAEHSLENLRIFTGSMNSLRIEGDNEKARDVLEWAKRSKGVNLNPAEIMNKGEISKTKYKAIFDTVIHEFITVRHETDENGATVEKPVELNSRQLDHFIANSTKMNRDVIGQNDTKKGQAFRILFYDILYLTVSGKNPTHYIEYGDTKYTYVKPEPETKKNNGKKKDEKPADEKTTG